MKLVDIVGCAVIIGFTLLGVYYAVMWAMTKNLPNPPTQ